VLLREDRVPKALQPSREPSQTIQTRLLSLGEKLSRLHYAFLSAPIALCLIDRDLRYVEVNERMARLNRRPIEAHIGRTLREIVPDIADAIEPVYRQVFATGCPTEGRPVAELTEDGERFLLVNYNPVKDDAGTTVLVSVAVFDITAEKKAREEAHISAQRLHDVLESTSDKVVLLSSNWQITYVNGHAAQLFAPRILAIGETLPQLFPDWADSIVGQKLVAISAARRAESFEAYFSVLDRWLELDVFPTSDGLSVFFRDVSDRRQAEEDERRAQDKIAHLASHDSLTGLANRVALYGTLDSLLAGMKADGEVVLLYLDLDGFKAVNDTMGHPAGDAVLVAVADRLRQCAGDAALVSRFGGDEFVIAKWDFGTKADISELAERIITAFPSGYDIEGQRVSIGISVGIALATQGVSSDELVRQADVALYAAKANGRRSYRFFEPKLGEAILLRQLRKRGLAQALPRNELYLDYQPIIDLKSRKIAGFEALLRWRSPLFSTVPVDSVIAIAEETGLIQSIGAWVLQEACREAAHWPEAIAIAVNVSVLQIRSEGFGDTVKRILADTGIAPSRLFLEITETVLFVEEKQANKTLEDLRQHGVRISLDDFGTGYASLQYLKTLKVDKIKIDQSFVRDAHFDATSRAILQAIVTLAQSLGIATVAEGVELESQYELLKRIECDFAQGFFLGKPSSGADCGILIRS
jgi:diguanylate cyclase (GGDEF)-like protein/PAS domain S-box-containing protein